jgi:hypothetical protein
MKMWLVAALIVTAGTSSAEPFVRSELDHLAPVNVEEHPSYRKLLRSKLCLTPFNCGRAILLPPFDPESSTSIYSVSNNGQVSYYVTEISVTANIWQRTDAVRYPERAKEVKVQRLDAQLPAQTAELIKRVYLRMLEGPHGPKRLPSSPRTIVLDATHADFSLERPNTTPLYGDLDFSLSFPGRKTKQLVDIWNRLYDYCKASADKRRSIASEIDQRAKRLLQDLR